MGLETHSRVDSPQVLHRLQPWYAAYMAALFEADRTLMEKRIRFAKQLIVSRERELFTSVTDTAERRALNNALHALRALDSYLKT